METGSSHTHTGLLHSPWYKSHKHKIRQDIMARHKGEKSAHLSPLCLAGSPFWHVDKASTGCIFSLLGLHHFIHSHSGPYGSILSTNTQAPFTSMLCKLLPTHQEVTAPSGLVIPCLPSVSCVPPCGVIDLFLCEQSWTLLHHWQPEGNELGL